MKTTIGGERLGSGAKMVENTTHYERSTHDLSYLWRSSAACGTLIPFMSQVALPGDTWDIDLNCEVMTLPTIGPLFGSYKVQLDLFEIPVRLYQGKLHMNLLNIGMKMQDIKLPAMTVGASATQIVTDNDQVNPSCLLSYLGIRGVGRDYQGGVAEVFRDFNAVPYLAYYDIFKNYYANKQEDYAYYIHNPLSIIDHATISNFTIKNGRTVLGNTITNNVGVSAGQDINFQIFVAKGAGWEGQMPQIDFDQVFIPTNLGNYSLNQLFDTIYVRDGGAPVGGVATTMTIICEDYKNTFVPTQYNVLVTGNRKMNYTKYTMRNSQPILEKFALTNIDEMRKDILAAVKQVGAFMVNTTTLAPYKNVLTKGAGGWPTTTSQEGLCVKTYQSDLFNNWINTEWIDGLNGVSNVTAIDTTGGFFTIDTLNLASKVYAMLNQISISGGTYDDWLDAVYTHERAKSVENPVYHGSLIKELMFEEVISNAETTEKPLGTLAGRGRLTQKSKGGKAVIKVNEPSYIMGIFSLTPRIDYSQGNDWDVNLKTLNDFHKPALDQIAYQDLITDQLAWWDTSISKNGTVYETNYQSMGKQPSWLNYMTNVNKTFGSFAEIENSMFMTLNRRYEPNVLSGVTQGIKDRSTYIDPRKYNQIFADTSLDAQNFWVQISNNITCRRKMSAKQIPNL